MLKFIALVSVYNCAPRQFVEYHLTAKERPIFNSHVSKPSAAALTPLFRVRSCSVAFLLFLEGVPSTLLIGRILTLPAGPALLKRLLDGPRATNTTGLAKWFGTIALPRVGREERLATALAKTWWQLVIIQERRKVPVNDLDERSEGEGILKLTEAVNVKLTLHALDVWVDETNQGLLPSAHEVAPSIICHPVEGFRLT